MAEREIAERFMHVDFIPGLQFKEPGRYQSLRYTVQTELEAIAGAGRSNRIRASDIPAAFVLYNRNKLPRCKLQVLYARNLKLEMVDFRRKFSPLEQFGFQFTSPLYDDARHAFFDAPFRRHPAQKVQEHTAARTSILILLSDPV